MLFLAVSFAITWVLKVPLLRGDLWLELGTDTVSALVIWVAVGVVTWLGWRCVGGRGSLQGTLLISFYYAGVLQFIQTFSYLGFLGMLRATDPAILAELMEAVYSGKGLPLALQASGRLHQSLGYRLSEGVMLLGAAAALAWVLTGWGAYRPFHRRGRFQSMLAFVVAALCWVPVWALTLVLANALLK